MSERLPVVVEWDRIECDDPSHYSGRTIALMAVDTSVIGKPTGSWRIRIERGPVANFAKSVKDDSPAYQQADAPAPPTFGFVMAHWGAFANEQPAGGTPD